MGKRLFWCKPVQDQLPDCMLLSLIWPSVPRWCCSSYDSDTAITECLLVCSTHSTSLGAESAAAAAAAAASVVVQNGRTYLAISGM